MDRRAFIASAASTLALPGCVTAPRPASISAGAGCLPPVKVGAGRLIRAVAGLRPYRPSGFVVRAQPLGNKKLVHNYGHGGAGITLSWGSSRLAVDLGLPGHGGPVAVIGAGVVGLTTARLVQEAGFPVTIYTEALTPHTTSNIAGGQISPFGHFQDEAVTPQWRAQFAAAMDYSWRRFQIMVGDDYGIRWLPTYQHRSSAAPPRPDPYHPGARSLSAGEHPFPVEHLHLYNTMYVETGRFLRQLTRDVQAAGGRIEVRKFGAPAQLDALREMLVFNCTGLGSRELFGDTELRPVRGQLAILLPQPEIGYAYQGQAGYMFPRADGIVLGGTFEPDEWETIPKPGDIERIVASHRELFGSFRC